MARIEGVDLPRNKRIEIGLQYIYGIGPKSAHTILAATNISPDIHVKDLTENDVRVSVNLAGAKEGETVFSVVKTNVSIPKGLQVEAIKPGTVKVTIDRVMEKRLKTVVKLDKGLASGYGIVSWFPHHVTAEGPEKILEGMSVIETNVVYGNFRSNEEVVEAGLNMDGLQLVKVKPETVKIVLRKQNGKGAFWD